MAATELILSGWFEESNMKMQSSTIYKALRGDGMRVRPLPRDASLNVEEYSNCQDRSSMPEKGRATKIQNMFELRVTSSNIAPKERLINISHNQLTGSGQPDRRWSEIRRRELTPVSEGSTQRMPFRSTKLERPVSRASLKEDDCDKRPKPSTKKKIDKRALQKKSLPQVEGSSKDISACDKVKRPANIMQDFSKTHKIIQKRKKLGVIRRATIVAGKPVIVHIDSPVMTRKEDLKTTKAGPKTDQTVEAASKALKTRPKPELKASSLENCRVQCQPKTSEKTPRNSVPRAVKSPAQPFKNRLWIPAEQQESFNQFCPDTKVKRMPHFSRTRTHHRSQKKKPRKDIFESQEQKSGTANTLARSKFDNTTDEESSEPDQEDARSFAQMQRRNDLMRRSQDFFNQFRYGEVLRKSMPEIRYASEILAESEAEVQRRMTEIEVRMRLSRLDESITKVNQCVPKWTSMLRTTKDVGKIEKIQKTLTNAEQIMNGKVSKARAMLQKYLSLVRIDGQSPPTEEMANIETHTELVQFDMDSLERVFESYERQLQQELEEPTSISL